MNTKLQVHIDARVHQKIMHWVNKSQYEVSGLGKLTFENGIFRIQSALLLPQRNGAAHTDIEGPDVAKVMFQLKDEPGDLRFWWHSHVNMGVFWSNTDLDTIAKLGEHGWFLSTVFNKKHEMRSAYYSATGYTGPWGEESVWLDEIPTVSLDYLPQDLIASWDAEYEKNVTNKSAAVGVSAPWGKQRKKGKRAKDKLTPNSNPSTTEATGTEQFDLEHGWGLPCTLCGFALRDCECDLTSMANVVPLDVDDADDDCPACGLFVTCDCDAESIAMALAMKRLNPDDGPELYRRALERVGAARGGPPTKDGKTGGW